MHHAALEALDRGFAGKAGHLDEPKPVGGEPRLPGLGAAARERVDVGGPGSAEVGEVERAVGLQPLGVPQGDPRAG